MSGSPGYWRNETGGTLQPAVRAYLAGEVMTPEFVEAMRAYLRHWIDHPGWRGPNVDRLRETVHAIQSAADIMAWLDLAEDQGIDPL